MLASYEKPARKRSCVWLGIALLVLLGALVAVAIWGYQRRGELVRYAVSTLVEQELDGMLPPGGDRFELAARVAALLRAVREGRIDAERLAGIGALSRAYYEDRHLDPVEFETLLSRAEAAVER